ncbi:MAG: DUF120 domain-containing protein [Acidobacteria bacterium]|nr:DUF120 domain-containing protein [Acidobacteriota bacterium]
MIEKRTGLKALLPGTLNLKIAEPYFVKPDATLSRNEYHGYEQVFFQRCRVSGFRCLIMRPETHELGKAHGPAHLEIMSDRHLRTVLGITEGAVLLVDVEGDDEWWESP